MALAEFLSPSRVLFAHSSLLLYVKAVVLNSLIQKQSAGKAWRPDGSRQENDDGLWRVGIEELKYVWAHVHASNGSMRFMDCRDREARDEAWL